MKNTFKEKEDSSADFGLISLVLFLVFTILGALLCTIKQLEIASWLVDNLFTETFFVLMNLSWEIIDVTSFFIIAVPLLLQNSIVLVVKITFLITAASVIIGNLFFLWISLHQVQNIMASLGIVNRSAERSSIQSNPNALLPGEYQELLEDEYSVINELSFLRLLKFLRY